MNLSAEEVADVPPVVVTVTSTVPLPAGSTAVICVPETTAKLLAAVEPNFTPLAAVKLVPVIVTVVPPAVGPEVGLIDVTVGAAGLTTIPFNRST